MQDLSHAKQSATKAASEQLFPNLYNNSPSRSQNLFSSPQFTSLAFHLHHKSNPIPKQANMPSSLSSTRKKLPSSNSSSSSSSSSSSPAPLARTEWKSPATQRYEAQQAKQAEKEAKAQSRQAEKEEQWEAKRAEKEAKAQAWREEQLRRFREVREEKRLREHFGDLIR
jgi:hypothetical protein